LTGAGTVTAQFAIVKVTGTLTTAKVVTGPSYSKTYTVVNAATGGIVTFKASGQTGVSVAVGESAFVYFNGTDYVKLVGTATAGAAGGSTTQVQYNNAGVLAGSANMTFNGTTLTVNDLTDSSLTAGRVTYAGTAGNLVDSANLTFNGTTLTANTLNLTNALGTAYGGTGLTSFTSGGVVYASSTSALATGSALTFNGTDFVHSGTSCFAATTGNVGVGTNSPDAKLRVVDGAGNGIRIGALSGSFNLNLYDATSHIFRNAGGTGEYATLNATGLGIGTSSPTTKLYVRSTQAAAVVDTLQLSNNASDAGTGSRISFHTADAVFNAIDGVRVGGGSGGRLAFYTMGTGGSLTERVRISEEGTLRTFSTISVGNVAPSTSGAGITFPATQSASSDANTLDDYEEGTWTPVATATSGSFTTVNTEGTYTKIGRQVTVCFTVYIVDKGTAAGYVGMTGLPFTSANVNSLGSGAVRNGLDGTTWTLTVPKNSTSIFSTRYDNSTAVVNNDSYAGSVTYFV
jgi:hypothetical protein